MSSQLEADIEVLRTACRYVTNCPLLSHRSGAEIEDVGERYDTICSTDRRYDCPQFILMGARE
ncbi:MAG: hypothetical protein AABX91_01590 [Nanoarchaeota archaeon]